jgi:hypothetical protein
LNPIPRLTEAKMSKTKLKTRLHFNRVNMVRGNPNVWTAHNSRGCFQAEKLVIMHDGKVIAETVFAPEAKQPRAYFVAQAEVKYRGKKAIIEV